MTDGARKVYGPAEIEERKRQVKAAFRTGRYRRLAEIVAEKDPYPGTTLLWAISWLLDTGRAEDLPDLAPVADTANPLPRRIWRALAGHVQGDPTALHALRRGQRLRPEVRAAARVWAVYGDARVDPMLLSRSERPGPSIIQFWDTEHPPYDVQRHMSTWQEFAGPLYRRFDAESAADFLSDMHGGDTADTFRSCRHPAIQADYFRLGALAAEGGLWLDADSVMVSHIRWMWPEMNDRLVLMAPNDIPWMFVQNCVMAAPAGSEFMLRAFKEAGDRLRRDPKRDVLSLAGPHMLRDVMAEMDRDGSLGPVSMLSIRHMRQYLARSADAAYKDDDRHWSNLPAPDPPIGDEDVRGSWLPWRKAKTRPKASRAVVARSMPGEMRRELIDILRADSTTQLTGFAERHPAHRVMALFCGIDILIVRNQVKRIQRLRPLVDPDHWLSSTVWDTIVRHLSGDVRAAPSLIARRKGPGRVVDDAAALWGAFLMAPRFDPEPEIDLAEADAHGPEIIQFWDRPKVPGDVSQAMAGWQDLAQDNYRLFNTESAADFLRDTYGSREAETLLNCGHAAIMSDYFRLGYLAAKGGFYVDADSVAKPEMAWVYPDMAGRNVLWVRTHTPWTSVSNGIMASMPETRLMTRAFEKAGQRLTSAGDLTDAVHLAGPGLIRAVMAQLISEGSMDPFHAMTSRFAWNRVFETLDADYKRDERNWTTWRRNQLAGEVQG